MSVSGMKQLENANGAVCSQAILLVVAQLGSAYENIFVVITDSARYMNTCCLHKYLPDIVENMNEIEDGGSDTAYFKALQVAEVVVIQCSSQFLLQHSLALVECIVEIEGTTSTKSVPKCQICKTHSCYWSHCDIVVCAISALCIPLSNVDSEQVFPYLGHILTGLRTNLKVENIEIMRSSDYSKAGL
ncbi:hypothetical protein PR048_018401 [Dryococelus australis]|uniref:HAT C-terminal dimerisation domain-containing protein n=1 Tax=Dryococelus australis TaxID=614101 RepID=A0ABQ9HCB3_9NEOP|nr:hypothetical protein PR048_018401 [Dryococelus australis]